jgi:hypothetical protein
MATLETEKGDKMTVDIRVYCDPELKRIAIDEANRRNLPLSELVALALAEYLERPELSEIPRLRPGRPLGNVKSGNGHKRKLVRQ